MIEELPVDRILRWYLEAGVDEAVGELPLDRYALSAPRAQAARPPAPAREPATPRPAAVVAGPGEAVAEAQRLAAAARDLDELRAALAAYDGCPLKAAATTTVFADGVAGAPVMVVGEAPGGDEDRVGRPFVGVSGQLLDRMLASIDLDRTRNIYITNVLPWRPPGNRKPAPAEVEQCLPFVLRHIALARPRLLILFGGAATAAVLGRPDPIGQLRGRWYDLRLGGLDQPVVCTASYHPAYLLRTPGKKREAWRDLLAVRQRLDALD